MKETRNGYDFSQETKDFVRARANGLCEFDGCEQTNNKIVNHINGVYVAKLDNLSPSTIVEASNAIVLCDWHKEDLDIQEEYQILNLLYERGTEVTKQIENHRKRQATFIGQPLEHYHAELIKRSA